MTVEQAEGIIGKMHTGVKVAYSHRFSGNKGTILRLDNYAMVNVFDDGRYYIQGDNTDELVIAFGLVEEAWDPSAWTSHIPDPDEGPKQVIRSVGLTGNSGKRFEF